MKNIITTLFLTAASLASSQVIIGDKVGTATTKTSVLLEFANTNNKGIVLPYVQTLPSAPTPGTIILDATVPAKARIKYYNGAWVDLSGTDGDVTSALAIQAAPKTDLATAKTIIGAQSSPADGILVLESTTKAMVLPTVTDVNNIPSPAPGMMVYVKGATNKRLAVYNGKVWSFWKP